MFCYADQNVSTILEQIEDLGLIEIVNQSGKILNLFINKIKVDFVYYKYDFLNDPIIEDGIRLASIPDIAAMKLAAITNRGALKDFIDLYFILNDYSLSQIMDFYKSKFPDGSELLVFKSLTYFVDAELEPMPKMKEDIGWDKMKAKIISEVKVYFP